MPNWVYNGLTIEGNPDSVNKLVAQVGKSFTMPIEVHNMGDVSSSGFPTKYKDVTYDKPIFAFWNIVNPYDQGISAEEYAQQPMRSDLDVNDPNWWSDVEAKRLVDKSWYSWNVTNWGCKWDVAVGNDEKYPDTYMEGPIPNGENLVVVYRFNTPWGIPDQALVKLSSQYPTLLFTLSYEEETGWGGEDEFLRGQYIQGASWNWKCKECDYMETGEPPYCEECEYDMCPSCGFGEPVETCEVHREKVEA